MSCSPEELREFRFGGCGLTGWSRNCRLTPCMETTSNATPLRVLVHGANGRMGQAVMRLALSGTNVGPSITGMIRVMGRERVLKRLEKFLAA